MVWALPDVHVELGLDALRQHRHLRGLQAGSIRTSTRTDIGRPGICLNFSVNADTYAEEEEEEEEEEIQRRSSACSQHPPCLVHRLARLPRGHQPRHRELPPHKALNPTPTSAVGKQCPC